MSLPLPWVDKIFDKLTLAYGQQFLARWRDLDLDAVKCDWAYELGGFEQAPHALAYGLSHLNEDRPPTAMAFRAICASSPDPVVQALPSPSADPARVAAELARLAPIMAEHRVDADMKGWARKLRARHKAGERLNLYQIDCYRIALGLDRKTGEVACYANVAN
jgi:hypothetical protein